MEALGMEQALRMEQALGMEQVLGMEQALRMDMEQASAYMIHYTRDIDTTNTPVFLAGY